MTRTSQKSQARYGTPIRCNVEVPVFVGLLAEAKRCKRSVGHIASLVLKYWYEDTYLPSQKGKSETSRL